MIALRQPRTINYQRSLPGDQDSYGELVYQCYNNINIFQNFNCHVYLYTYSNTVFLKILITKTLPLECFALDKMIVIVCEIIMPLCHKRVH